MALHPDSTPIFSKLRRDTYAQLNSNPNIMYVYYFIFLEAHRAVMWFRKTESPASAIKRHAQCNWNVKSTSQHILRFFSFVCQYQFQRNLQERHVHKRLQVKRRVD